MSIFGAKKTNSDKTKTENELSEIKNNIVGVYKNITSTDTKILNIENTVKKINDKPDRKIISITAGIKGPVQKEQLFIFSEGGMDHYVMNFPGQILGFSLIGTGVGVRGINDNAHVLIRVRGLVKYGYGSVLNGPYTFINFEEPWKFEGGSVISFIINNVTNMEISSIQATAIVELFL